MFSKFKKEKRILKAISDENPELLEKLLKSGGNPNAQNNNDGIPIFKVIEKSGEKQLEMLRLLIRYGADLNYKDDLGSSVIHNVESTEIAEILVDSGADLNIKNKWESSVLHTTYYVEMASFFISKGVDVNLKNIEGSTPLFHAVDQGLEFTGLLLENGAKAEVQDNNGYTPLMYAAMMPEFMEEEYHIEYKTIISELLKAGAKIDTKNNEGKNACDYALEIQNYELVEFLNSIKTDNL